MVDRRTTLPYSPLVRAAAAGGVDFDGARLASFLDTARPETAGAPLELERISGGQSNPTYFLTRGPASWVLRKQPAKVLVKGAHDMSREYKIIAALWPTAVPVPEPVLFVDDAEIIGTQFY